MKGFCKFLLFFVAAIVLWNLFASPDVEVIYSYHGDSAWDGFWANVLSPFIVALVFIGVVFLIFGVFAAIVVAFAIAGFSLLFVGLSVFWPVLVAIALFYWLFSDSKQKVS